MQATVAVLGAGAWGTALAVLLADNGHRTLLWARNPERVSAMASERRNAHYLPQASFPAGLRLSADLSRVVEEAEEILVAVPTAAFRMLLQAVLPALRPGARLVWVSKGLEPGTGRMLHEVATEILGPARSLAVISGPTFAREVALGLPTAVTVASVDIRYATDFASYLHNERFRAYSSDDMIGVELGGAVKNVLAIAAGIADGLGFGANTRAALVTRGLAEMMRLGVALGGRRETLMGLAGLGDLVLTCTDDQSRNRRVGLALARGETWQEACRHMLAEGVNAAREVGRLAEVHRVEMPITRQVCRVLYDGLAPHEAVQKLLAREQKAENS